jgi:hypothetical protein
MRKECHWKEFTSVGLDESNVLLPEVEGETQARTSVNEVRPTWHYIPRGLWKIWTAPRFTPI